nr:MAG TPA: hypothetical protein [Caudoviricetes sp.]
MTSSVNKTAPGGERSAGNYFFFFRERMAHS